MAKYIDADELIKTLNREGVPFNEDVNYFILHAPAADVVEVVRCKDCKHSGYQYRDFHGTEKVVCWKDGYGIHKNANGYCDDGELKDEKDGEQDG